MRELHSQGKLKGKQFLFGINQHNRIGNHRCGLALHWPAKLTQCSYLQLSRNRRSRLSCYIHHMGATIPAAKAADSWLNSVETMCGATYTFKLWSWAWRWKSSPGSWFMMWLYFNYTRAFWANPIAFSNPSVNPQEVKKTAALQLLTPFSKNTGSTECTKKPRKQSGNNYVKWNLLIFSSTLVLVSQVCGKR